MFVTECEGFTVYQFVWDIINSNCYVICGKHSLFIVDPIDSEEFYQFIEKKKEQMQTDCKAIILLTHSHYDHISGLNHLRGILKNSSVLCSKTCSANIQDPKKNLSNIANAIIAFQDNINSKAEIEDLVKPFFCAPADKTFDKELAEKWEGHSLLLTEYSGHSKDSICCIVDGKYMFSGDTLLPIPTVTRLPGGSTARFWEEDMSKLENLREQIGLVFPGHEMPGRLKDMLAVNMKPERCRNN